ncbi:MULTISPECIES: hypothetical protein [unclassified Curtobacterium]|uniref:hypothetical protein n=1 Tax=unclassified Curtobacterium TaxID=257496 RepID=UPI0008DD7863|nr:MULTISPECIES: hypothetical protein [unclassified Curtobacterium]OIH99601.1 hypothetical protein BIU92_01545 [Curtobacterium sp. MCBA15_003]OII11502.1 hypothetical protein BIU97_06315 [Curtobacterium sp. MCBA15_009]OII30564.1 hypothetical protein BIU94_07350 [Curtobacterium sp. MMLR14_006]
MPARGGDWALLGESTDPVIADVPVVNDLVHYYTTIADEITSEAAVLKSIGEGDESQFKGETANAVRKKSKEVAESLQKMAGRYEAIRDALTGYVPSLEQALDESAAALRDAEDASAAGARASGMADPSQGRASDAPPLTDDEQGQIDAKHRAESSASDSADAAKARLRRAVDALNAAGKAASATIRGAWHDGLHDTLGDKIKAFFSKLLKILVKIFTYIGIALAALAILIPGVGVLAIMGAVAAGVSLVAQIGLTALGEGNVFDLVMAVVGVVTLGVGVGITKATSIAMKQGIAKGTAGFQKVVNAKLEKLSTQRFALLDKLGKPGTFKKLTAINKQSEQVIGKFDGFVDTFKNNPNWWNLSKFSTVAKNDWKTISTQFGSDLFTRKGFTSWAERIGGVDFQVHRNFLNKWGSATGIETVSQAPKWHTYVNGGMSVWGRNYSIAGLVLNPIGDGADTKRPWTDDWNETKHPISV